MTCVNGVITNCNKHTSLVECATVGETVDVSTPHYFPNSPLSLKLFWNQGFLFYLFYYICVSVRSNLCFCTMCMQYLWRPEGIGSPETRVTDVCEPLCGCWEFNPGSLERKTSALNC